MPLGIAIQPHACSMSVKPLITSRPQIALRKASGDIRRANRCPSTTPAIATPIRLPQRVHSAPLDSRPAQPMLTSTALALTRISAGVLARSACTSSRRRRSHAAANGPEGAKQHFHHADGEPHPMDPWRRKHRPLRWLRPQRIHTHAGDIETEQNPTRVPMAIPGSRHRSSTRFTCRRLKPLSGDRGRGRAGDFRADGTLMLSLRPEPSRERSEADC